MSTDPQDPVPDRVTQHVAAFNTAVVSGDWTTFAERFAPDATMAFHGVPTGPFIGRERIRAAYAASPPDDTLKVTAVATVEDVDDVSFRWARGGAGSMKIRWRGGVVLTMDVAFDDGGSADAADT